MRERTTETTEVVDLRALVEQYKGLRVIARRLLNEVLPGYLSKRAFLTCGKRLGMMQGKTLVSGDEGHTNVLMDYCLYEYQEEGGNTISRYMADTGLFLQADEYTLVKAMSEAFYTLVLVKEVIPGVGVRILDVFTSRGHLLIDMGFSKTAKKGLMIATRLLPFEGYVTTGGAPLVVNAESLAEIRDYILPGLPTQDGHRSVPDAKHRTDLTTAIIRRCLRQASTYVKYEGAPAALPVWPARRQARTGRNDPCPCGSGKKYKHCCGHLA